MKLVFVFVIFVITVSVMAQDIDQIGVSDVNQLKSGSSNELQELQPPAATTTPPPWETREGIEAHVRASQCTLSHSAAACNCKQSYRPVIRAKTARKEGSKTTITVNVHTAAPKAAGVPDDPDFGGVLPADPNLAAKNGVGLTYARTADGGLYFNAEPGGGDLTWLWVALAVLGAAALVALAGRALGSSGGGGNHYYNYPSAPQPPAAPAAPAGNQPGWQGQGTVVVATPTGGSGQQPVPVVVNIHHHHPPKPPKSGGKKAGGSPPAQAEEK